MQKYTKLKVGELISRFHKDFADDYSKEAEKSDLRGWDAPNDLKIIDIGIKRLNKITDEGMSAEKTILSKYPKKITKRYFDDLVEEFLRLIEGECNIVRERVIGGAEESASTRVVERELSKIRSSVISRVRLLQEELKLEGLNSSVEPIIYDQKPAELIELKPNFFGFGINLKVLFNRLFNR